MVWRELSNQEIVEAMKKGWITCSFRKKGFCDITTRGTKKNGYVRLDKDVFVKEVIYDWDWMGHVNFIMGLYLENSCKPHPDGVTYEYFTDLHVDVRTCLIEQMLAEQLTKGDA